MNNKRAIELLHRLQDEQFDGQHGDERREALSMAVRALEGDGDTISRQAAIEDVEEYADRLQMVDWKDNPGVPYKVHALNWCINTLRELPSAQLATDINVGDTISRQQAIDALDKRFDSIPMEQTTEILMLRKDLRELPSAQPEVLACRSGELVQESGDLVKELVKDCISRKMAIDAFEPTHYIDWYTPTIIETLEALPFVKPEPHWIPCSERLPSEGDTVLLYENYAYSIGRLFKTATGEYEWSVNGWYTKIDDWSVWMPLPKPYGGESDAD